MLSLLTGNQQSRLILKLFLKKLDSQNQYNVISKRHYAFSCEKYFDYMKSILQEANMPVSKLVFFNLKGIHVKYLTVTF